MVPQYLRFENHNQHLGVGQLKEGLLKEMERNTFYRNYFLPMTLIKGVIMILNKFIQRQSSRLVFAKALLTLTFEKLVHNIEICRFIDL